jgi:ADP-ribosyl-[dinitrogen reductase] hydrolase
MAICLAESLIARGGLDPLDLMARFQAWRYQGHNSVTGRYFDIGNTTQAAIDRFISSGDPLSGDTSPQSAGNGSIMRLAPVAIFFRNDPEAAAAQAAEQSRTTHGAGECLESCALMARILTALLGGQDWDIAIRQDRTVPSNPKVRALANLGWKQKTRKDIRSSGYVIDTLEAALWSVDQTESFRDALLLAVNLGDDADTVGAVTGQFAGARYGLSGIPNSWLSKLAWHQKLLDLAVTLAA